MNALTTSQQFGKSLTDVSDSEYRRLRTNFDNFLDSTPLIEHFIACDENGEPMETYIKTEDEIYADENVLCRVVSKAESQWYKAQKQVLFEGWEAVKEELATTAIKNGNIKIHFFKSEMVYVDFNGLDFCSTYSDITKYQLQTNNNFKELIYGK